MIEFGLGILNLLLGLNCSEQPGGDNLQAVCIVPYSGSVFKTIYSPSSTCRQRPLILAVPQRENMA